MKRLLVLLLVPCVAWGLRPSIFVPALAQGVAGAGVRYFPEAGHSVKGEFLAYFDQHGGLDIFGPPRTDEFVEDGTMVQYFQRARMEHHPDNPEAYKVQLSLLGDMLGYRQAAIPVSCIPPSDHPQRRYYAPTGHTVSYAFLDFFDSHGGLDVFGFPITELLTENGTVVQYFQRSKMEWHPENPTGYQVTLASLGDEYASRVQLPTQNQIGAVSEPSPPPRKPSDSYVAPQAYVGEATSSAAVAVAPEASGDEPVPSPAVPPRVAFATEFSASASVKYPISGQGGWQTVYAQVVDSTGQGVAGAVVEVIVHFRGGDRVFRADETDASGSTALSFGIGTPPPGCTVIVEVRATHGERTETAQTMFIPWW